MRFVFSARQVAPTQGTIVDILPLDFYPIVITSHDIKPIQGMANSARLSFGVEVLQGHPLQGKKSFIGLNIQHDNEFTMGIALGQLSAICWSVGKTEIQDLNELHGIPFIGQAKPTERGNNWDAFKTIQGQPAVDLAASQGIVRGGATQGHTPPTMPPAGPPAAQGQTWGPPQPAQPQQQQPWVAPAMPPQQPSANWGSPPAGQPAMPPQGQPQGQPQPAWGGQPAQPAGAPPWTGAAPAAPQQWGR